VSIKDEKKILCDFDGHVLDDTAPRVSLSGNMINVEGAPGGLSLDFCSWAHAIGWAQAQHEFSAPPGR
jgi:hypothetical protein